MNRRALVTGSVLLALATFGWHLSNFVFNGIAARYLGPAHYGTLAAVMALLYVASPVLLSVQTIAARLSTELDAHGQRDRIRPLVRYYGVRLAGVAVFALAFAVILSRPAARFLHIGSAKPLSLLALALSISVFSQLQRGALQGTRLFGRFAASVFIESAVKVVSVVILLELVARDEAAAVGAIVVSTTAASLAGTYLVRVLPAGATVRPVSHPYRYSAATLATMLLLAGLFSFDVLAAKHYLQPHAAGVYAAAALAAKVAYFGTTIVSLLSFPVFSTRLDTGRDARPALAAALALVAGLGLTVTALYWLAPSVVVRPLFGHRFDDARSYLGLLALAITFYAIAYQCATYLLARRIGTGVAVLAVAQLAQLSLLYSRHASAHTIAVIQLGVLAPTALVMCAACLYPARRRASATIPSASAGRTL